MVAPIAVTIAIADHDHSGHAGWPR
jgi:hypothetical protein